MDSENIVRIAISSGLVVLIGVALTGWIWTGSHQAAPQALASRVVLTVCIAAGLAGLTVLWRPRRR